MKLNVYITLESNAGLCEIAGFSIVFEIQNNEYPNLRNLKR